MKNDIDTAIKKLEHALNKNERLKEAYQDLAKAYAANTEYVKAAKTMEDAIGRAYDSDDQEVLNSIAYYYRKDGDYQKSEDWYKKVLNVQIDDIRALYGLGRIQYLRGENRLAIKEFNRINTSNVNDKNKCLIQRAIGEAYLKERKFNEAKIHLDRSIEIDKSNIYTLGVLGDLSRETGDYEEAINLYRKVISQLESFSENKQIKAQSLHKRGTTYQLLGKYDEAIDDFKEASDSDNTFESPYIKLGEVYQKLKDFESSKYYFDKANELAEKNKNHDLAKLIRKRTKKVSKEIELKKKLKSEEDQNDLCNRILKITHNKIEKDIKIDLPSENFLKEREQESDKKKKVEVESYFKVLRRWNSYAPILSESKGGGYFIKYKGHGIVIDPGFNFIDNFIQEGYRFHEIDSILISHAHNDHTADLESILTLLFEYNEKVLENMRPNYGLDLSEDFERPVIPDERRESFEKELTKRRKIINIYVSLSTFQKFSGFLDLKKHKESYEIIPISVGQEIPINIEKCSENDEVKNKLNITVLKAKHSDVLSFSHAVGFMLDFNQTVLIYTGDTGWCKFMSDHYSMIKEKIHNKKIILLAHLGGIKECEYKYLVEEDEEEKEKTYYKNHLGILGLTKLAQTIKPDICFVSEFGIELLKVRELICSELQKVFNDEVLFLPADIGLKYSISTHEIEAITSLELKREYIDPKNVAITPVDFNSSLHYYEKGKVNESRLGQALHVEEHEKLKKLQGK